ncbi:MAG: ATP-binding protein [Lachnospiraceae bacterium]|jgi:predicted AAA+ superfamily ATPase
MNNEIYLPRLIDKRVTIELEIFGAICIEGAKWCGKTWTSKHHSKSAIYLGDPSRNFQNKELMKLEPETALNGEVPRLIDEWQEVPSVWDIVRYEVDERGKKGQFILTGSSTPIQKGILHSGAGRISTIRMRPMSLFESKDSSGQVSLQSLFSGSFEAEATKDIGLRALIELTIRGGWPGSLGLNYEQYRLIPKEYINSIINHDIYRLEGINRDSKKMQRLLRSLARNESTTASISTLRKDIKEYEDDLLDNDTISTYLTLFERLFLIDNQKAFSSNIRSATRIKQSDKRHFVDPSLAIALLGASYDDLLNDLNTFGFMFEALCERDLRIYAESLGGELYHYQDYKNREIDAIVELEDGRWGAFEIKLGADAIDDAAKSLIEIRDALEVEGAKIPDVLAVICGLSNFAYRREDGVYVVPITALRP